MKIEWNATTKPQIREIGNLLCCTINDQIKIYPLNREVYISKCFNLNEFNQLIKEARREDRLLIKFDCSGLRIEIIPQFGFNVGRYWFGVTKYDTIKFYDKSIEWTLK